ncbi:hypothetical protein [uncultured Desulfovibrio sp.]|uniref:hypothetical protein n=1 Tax=uncultured Desulfovibrio sp. TaxID=167968 RepID=UPI0026231F9F|nr:hypothetical protein [uncultured Desulfovibrio sp.]
MSSEDIEIAADWTGTEGGFVAALQEVGFLDGDEGGMLLHDWKEHNSWASEADDRSDQARLSKLATVNREAYEELKARGATGIGKEEYEKLKASWRSPDGRSTSAERSQNERRTNAERTLTNCTTPSPSPAQEEIQGGSNIYAPARVADSVPENPAEDTPAVPAAPKRTDCPSKGHPQWRAFLSCWDVYPVQQRQEEAWREWMRLYENHTLAEPYVIRDAILLLSQEDSRWRRGKVRDMSKWLNGKGWNDKPFCEPSAAVPVAPAGGGQTRAPTEHQRRQQESRNMAAALLAAREQERQQHRGGGHAGQAAIGDAAR